MNGEHAFDQHLSQIIERLGGLDEQQDRRQRVALARQHLPHPGRIQRFGLGSELLDLAMRNTREEVRSKQVALLRERDQVRNEQLHMCEGRTGRVAFEILPGGPEGGGLDNKQGVQRGFCLIGEVVLHLVIDAMGDDGASVMGCPIQCPKGRQFKAAVYQLLKSDIDQIGQVVFGSGGFDHRTEKRFPGRWTIGLDLQRFSDEGQVPSARSRIIVAC